MEKVTVDQLCEKLIDRDTKYVRERASQNLLKYVVLGKRNSVPKTETKQELISTQNTVERINLAHKNWTGAVRDIEVYEVIT